MARCARFLVLLLALAGYAANGAQAHIHVTQGETLTVQMCSVQGERTVTMTLPGEPPAETPETCCGDCTAPAVLPADPPVRLLAPMSARSAYAPPHAPLVHPGSPLWPGAPPQGPPALFNTL